MNKLMMFTTVAGHQYIGRNYSEDETHFNLGEVHLVVPRRENGNLVVDFVPFGAPLAPVNPNYIVSFRKTALMVDPDDAPKNIVRAFSQFQTGLVLPE